MNCAGATKGVYVMTCMSVRVLDLFYCREFDRSKRSHRVFIFTEDVRDLWSPLAGREAK